MIILTLGIIIGILLSFIFIVSGLIYKPRVDRFIKQTESKFKTKGSIIEPESEELEQWVEELPNQ